MARAKQVTGSQRLWIAAGALARACAPMLAVAVAPIAAALVIGAVLFGPTGMQPFDVAEASSHSTAVRIAVWAAWLAALAPAALRLGQVELAYFRWLPIPSFAFWLLWAAFLAAINAPFVLFWLIASGPTAALFALTLTTTFHAALLARGAARALSAALAIAIIAFSQQPSLLGAGVGAAGLVFAIPIAWRRAGEGRRFALRPTPRGAPWRALMTLLTAAFIDPLVGLRLVVAALVFGGLGGLVVRTNQLPASSALTFISAMVAIGAVGLCAHAASTTVVSWRQMRWLVRTTATRPAAQTTALLSSTMLMCALTGSLIAATATVVAELDVGPSALTCLAGAAAAIAIGAVSVTVAAHCSPRKAGWTWIAALLAALAIATMLAALGSKALIIVPATVVLAAVYLSEATASEVGR